MSDNEDVAKTLLKALESVVKNVTIVGSSQTKGEKLQYYLNLIGTTTPWFPRKKSDLDTYFDL